MDQVSGVPPGGDIERRAVFFCPGVAMAHQLRIGVLLTLRDQEGPKRNHLFLGEVGDTLPMSAGTADKADPDRVGIPSEGMSACFFVDIAIVIEVTAGLDGAVQPDHIVVADV